MNVFNFFGSAVCHQMAERSFFWGSCQSPLCARCTAIEGGIILGVIFLMAGRTKRRKSTVFALWHGAGGFILSANCH